MADEGETPEAAAVRECVEETALWPIAPRLLRTIDMGTDGLLYAYVSEVGEGPMRTCWESETHAWVGLNEVEGYSFVPCVKDLILAALSNERAERV
jgi:8-oxo-dGTP pyrophosphatase MutT (NUDIX family)